MEFFVKKGTWAQNSIGKCFENDLCKSRYRTCESNALLRSSEIQPSIGLNPLEWLHWAQPFGLDLQRHWVQPFGSHWVQPFGRSFRLHEAPTAHWVQPFVRKT